MMMKFIPAAALSLLFMLPSAAHAKLTLTKRDVKVDVGAAEKIKVTSDNPAAVKWESKDTAVAQVFGNGWIVGVKPGATVVRVADGSDTQDFKVTVDSIDKKLADISQFKQYPDNRIFRINGRKFAGTQLNGQAVAKEDHEDTESNRVINPRPLDPKRAIEWEVQDGTEIFDGAGVLMGTVASKIKVEGRSVPTSKFNYGMSKIIHGRPCVYAFSVAIKPDEKIRPLLDAESQNSSTVGTSAWLPLDRVVDQDNLLDRLNIGSGKLPRLTLETRKYKITGGDPSEYMTEHGELGIVEKINSGPSPLHYIRRPSGTVNILYSVPGYGLGGQGCDSILLNGDAIFRPAKGVKRFVQPTYYQGTHPRAGKVSNKTMTFVYGAVEVEGSETIYGWIALEALTPTK